MIPPRFLHGFTVIQRLNVLLAIEAGLCERSWKDYCSKICRYAELERWGHDV